MVNNGWFNDFSAGIIERQQRTCLLILSPGRSFCIFSLKAESIYLSKDTFFHIKSTGFFKVLFLWSLHFMFLSLLFVFALLKLSPLADENSLVSLSFCPSSNRWCNFQDGHPARKDAGESRNIQTGLAPQVGWPHLSQCAWDFHCEPCLLGNPTASDKSGCLVTLSYWDQK